MPILALHSLPFAKAQFSRFIPISSELKLLQATQYVTTYITLMIMTWHLWLFAPPQAYSVHSTFIPDLNFHIIKSFFKVAENLILDLLNSNCRTPWHFSWNIYHSRWNFDENFMSVVRNGSWVGIDRYYTISLICQYWPSQYDNTVLTSCH